MWLLFLDSNELQKYKTYRSVNYCDRIELQLLLTKKVSYNRNYKSSEYCSGSNRNDMR